MQLAVPRLLTFARAGEMYESGLVAFIGETGHGKRDLRRRARQCALRHRHGHFLRILAVRWCGLDAVLAEHLELDPARISVLGTDRGTPTIRSWNG